MKSLQTCLEIGLVLFLSIACAPVAAQNLSPTSLPTNTIPPPAATTPPMVTASPLATNAVQVLEPTLAPTPIPPRIVLSELGIYAEYQTDISDVTAVLTDGLAAFAWARTDWSSEQQTDVYPGFVFVPRTNLTELRAVNANHPVALALYSDEEHAVTGSADGAIEVWSTVDGTRKQELGKVAGQPTTIVLSPDETLLAVGARGRYQGGDGSVTIWKKGVQAPIKTLPAYGAVTRAAFASDNTLYFSTQASSCARGGGGVFEWDETKQDATQIFSAVGNPVTDIAIHPQDNVIASVGQSTQRCIGGSVVTIWDRSNGQVTRILTPTIKYGAVSATTDVASVAFSPDGARLAIGMEQGYAQVLDWQSERVITNIGMGEDTVSRVKFLNNNILLMYVNDGYIRLYPIFPK